MSTLSIARDSARWRPDYIVSHIDIPVYNSARTTRTTYAKILPRLPRVLLQGVWVLKDVHIVDANVAELMACFKRQWSRGSLHLVLLSPAPDAARQWATYVGCDNPTLGPTPRPPRCLIANMPDATVVQLSQWMDRQSLKGDVLVFARSATHRDAICETFTCCNLQVPVHKVETRVPYHNGGPRILVGTSTLDYILDMVTKGRIQHVIDFGRVYKLRQDTGNDWQETFITQSVAEGRAAAAQSSAPGICLRVYPAEGSLSNDALATHNFSHDTCLARLLIRCGPRALHNFPIALPTTTMDMPIARLMVRLNVERPIATMLHVAPSLDVGIGIAAVVGRRGVPYNKDLYESFVQTSLPLSTMKYISAWASTLGRSPRKIVKALSRTTWEDVLPVIFQGYKNTIAIAVGDTGKYIDANTGDILTCRYSYLTTSTIVYTHRQNDTIQSFLPIPPSWVPPDMKLQTTRVHSPLRLGNDILLQAMRVWFETKQMVAWHLSPTLVEVACAAHVNLSDAVAEWTRTMHDKALGTPLVVPLLGHSIHMVFTAGMRFTDAATASDFLVMRCKPEALTRSDLLFLHQTPGLWDTDASMILGTRKEAEDLWGSMQNVTVTSLGTEYQKFQPCQVVARLVVKVYCGKSTGRAVIQTSAGKEWISTVDPAWMWEIHEDVDLVSLYSRNTTAAATVYNIPEHMDELDIAGLIHIEPRHVMLERTVQLLTYLPCVTRFFRAVSSDHAAVETVRGLRYAEFSMDIAHTSMEKALRLAYDLLPLTNDVVNQPLRISWELQITKGSHPSDRIERGPTTVIPIARHEFDKDWAVVTDALANATRLATHYTPSLSWCPSLAVPWIHINDIPLVEGHGGPLLRLYGSEEDKERSRKALSRLAQESSSHPNPGTYDTCPICLDPTACYPLAICGCRLCPPCLAQAFEAKCMDSTFFGEIQCPYPTCQERVSTEDLAILLRPKTLRIYATRIAKFLSSRIPDIIRECPSKCGVFSRAHTTPHQQSFHCEKCNTSWCIKCSDKAGTAVASHQGFCDQRWESEYWKAFAEEVVQAGARPCPQCATYVSKDGGCNHVACVAPNCRTHFCWKCMQAFSHVQLSPMAQGVIQEIRGDTVTIAVDPSTWKTPCHTPAPKIVTYRTAHARSMLVDSSPFKPQARIWVYSYVYDHLDACACT